VQGILLLVVANLFLGLWGVAARIIGVDFGVFFFLFVRSLIILSLLAGYSFFRSGAWKRIEKGDLRWFLAMSLIGFISSVSGFLAFNALAIGITYFVFYAISTLGGYFFGRTLFKEKLSGFKIVSLVISLFGLSLIFSVNLTQETVSLALAMLAGFTGAGWNIFSKKISSKYSLTQICLIDSLIVFLASLVLTVISQESVFLPTFSESWIVVFLFSLITLVSAFLVISGFRRLQAQAGTLLMLLEPVFGILFAWLFFKEALTAKILIGGALILLGAALPNIRLANNNAFNRS
jgi:drug/metabolite transporter (DMT)-like permease